MTDRSIKFKELKRILARYDVTWNKAGGKGSHGMFEKRFPDGVFSYPVPTRGTDVLVAYVRGCRKKFRLTTEHGVSDKEFYEG